MIKVTAKNKEKMLELRRKAKARKPRFLRQDYHKVKSLEKKWIRPRGLHAKLRLGRRGHRSRVSPGYGSPREVRGLSREGLIPVLVKDIKTLKMLDPAKSGIIISSSVGTKNRVFIIKEAMNLGIKILNIKDPLAYLKKVEDARMESKKEKTEKEHDKKKKKDELEKKAAEKEKEKKLEETLTDEEKKEKEKEEKAKVLTKKA